MSLTSKIAALQDYEEYKELHWEGSFDCVKAALRQGGYSCFAKNYLGHWMKDLGGSAHAPLCD